MTDDETPDPQAPLRDLFMTLATANAARTAAIAVANIQAEHHRQLIIAGMSPEVALEISARMGETMANACSEVVKAFFANAETIVNAMKRFQEGNE
jgi:hypothetical protein